MADQQRIQKVKRISLWLMAGFYLFAGFNHFRDASFYFPLIPEYLQDYSHQINLLSGGIEMAFGLGILLAPTRNWAAYGIMLMLLAFIPSHVYFIKEGGCMSESLCIPAWVAWVRLIVIHPMLILWAWWHRN